MTVRLTWVDNNADETGHQIYRSTSPMDPAALPPTKAFPNVGPV